MDEKGLLRQEDCRQVGHDMSVIGKVIVLHPCVLSKEYESADRQLYFCMGDSGDNSIDLSILTVSLADGVLVCWKRRNVLGIAKPEALSEKARMQLSQIRPIGALDLKDNEPQYSGYCFLQDGRYTSGVWLCSPEEVWDYIEMQKDYQHRIMICDRQDFCVLEIMDGKIIYPLQDIFDAHRSGLEPKDMELDQ